MRWFRRECLQILRTSKNCAGLVSLSREDTSYIAFPGMNDKVIIGLFYHNHSCGTLSSQRHMVSYCYPLHAHRNRRHIDLIVFFFVHRRIWWCNSIRLLQSQAAGHRVSPQVGTQAVGLQPAGHATSHSFRDGDCHQSIWSAIGKSSPFISSGFQSCIDKLAELLLE